MTSTPETPAPAATRETPAALARLGDALWRVFTNVKLGVFWLLLLAVLSIIGTIIPQTTGSIETLQGYVARLGPERAALYDRLGLLDVYHSWWFLAVLVLMCTSIAAVSIDRWPRIHGEFSSDEPVPPPQRFAGSLSKKWTLLSAHTRLSDFQALFSRFFGAPQISHVGEKEAVLYSNRGRWTRMGVYFVHIGILTTSAGAVLGKFWGFTNGQTYIREGSSSDRLVILSGVSPQGEVLTRPHELPFAVRCDDFEVQFYDDPKTGEKTRNPSLFRSRLTILDGGREVLTRDIFVNDPLRYGGYTFYQASYDEEQEPLVRLAVQTAGTDERFPITTKINESFQLAGEKLRYVIRGYEEDFEIPEAGVLGPAIGIEMIQEDGTPATVKEDGKERPLRFLIFQNYPDFDARREGRHIFRLESVEKKFSTGLQVAKDPGVWIVWTGSALMVFGMVLAFFLSHQKTWLKITAEGAAFGAVVHKHRLAYENKVATFFEALEKEFPAARKIET